MMVVSIQLNHSKSSNNALQYRRTSQFIANLGVIVRSRISYLINDSDETHGCKSLRLIAVGSDIDHRDFATSRDNTQYYDFKLCISSNT